MKTKKPKERAIMEIKEDGTLVLMTCKQAEGKKDGKATSQHG